MSDREEVEYSPYRTCDSCDVMAFEPESCVKCGLLCCTDCRETCETCGETYCNGAQNPGGEPCLEHHGCKRAADPADVLVLEGQYADNWVQKLEEVYRINGRTYFVIAPRGRGHLEPPDATIYQYEGTGERDVFVMGSNNGAYVAEPYVKMEEVGRVNGVTGKTEWYGGAEGEAEVDHRGADA